MSMLKHLSIFFSDGSEDIKDMGYVFVPCFLLPYVSLPECNPTSMEVEN